MRAQLAAALPAAGGPLGCLAAEWLCCARQRHTAPRMRRGGRLAHTAGNALHSLRTTQPTPNPPSPARTHAWMCSHARMHPPLASCWHCRRYPTWAGAVVEGFSKALSHAEACREEACRLLERMEVAHETLSLGMLRIIGWVRMGPSLVS